MDGPAQRQSLFVGVEEAAELPIEELDEAPPSTEVHQHAELAMPATTMIAIDPTAEPRPVQLLHAMQPKRQLVQIGAATARLDASLESPTAGSSDVV